MDIKGGANKVDSLRIKKTKRLKIDFSTSYQRIKIVRPNKKRLLIAFPVISFLAIVLLIILFLMQTTAYQVFRLASLIKDESIIVGFQNSAELRPTGGFWGSFALLESNKNVLESKLLFDTNPYKQDNQFLKVSKAQLPEPMAQMWKDRPQSFVNANWFMDFPESAKTLEWYFAQGWGGEKNINGVIAISSLAMIDLLELIGPIEAPDGTIIRSSDFTRTMSEKIDEDYWDTEKNKEINEPKTIIKEIFPIIIKKTKELSKMTLFNYFHSQLEKGRILAYFNDKDKQSIAKRIGITGEILTESQDYLSINNANIGGHKSSLNVHQRIDYEVKETDSNYIGRLNLKRTYKPNWPYGVNANYTRILTPLGSKIISAVLDGEDISESIDITTESGKTVFGLWMSVPSGNTKILELYYQLPFAKKWGKDYHLIYQKQPGTNDDWINVTIFDNVIYTGTMEKSQLILNNTQNY